MHVEIVMNRKEAYDEGKATVDDVADTLRDGINKTDKATTRTVRQGAAAAKEFVGKAEAAANSAIDDTKDAVDDIVDTAEEKWDRTRSAFFHWGRAATHTVRKYPLASIAAIGVVGLLAGSVLRLRR
jgi:ElaB/YqjD/DUF883 family membrane-anchored ribosome-binding protein